MNANKQDAGGLPERCPFCGDASGVGLCYFGQPAVAYAVTCNLCGADGPRCIAPDEAMAAWNRRNGEQCRAASGVAELRETAEHNWMFIEHVTNWIIGRGLLEITHEGGSLEAAKNITDSLDRALSRGVPEGST